MLLDTSHQLIIMLAAILGMDKLHRTNTLNPIRFVNRMNFGGNSNKILVENSTGRYGTENGDFKSPQSVAIDPQNKYIFVADLINSRVQVFSFNLSFLFSFPRLSLFLFPYGICVSGHLVFITTSSTDYLKNDLGQGLFIYTTNGDYVGSYLNIFIRNEEMQFKSPRGIAVDNDHTVYIADHGKARIIELHNDLSQFKVLFYSNGLQDVKIYKRNIYVLSVNSEVQSISLENKSFIRKIRAAPLPNNFTTEFFAITDNGFFLSNRRTNCILYISYKGILIAQYSNERMFSHIKGIAMLDNDRIINVCEKDSGRLKILKLS